MPEIQIILKDLPTSVRGFCCLGSNYEPCIVINSRMTVEQQRKTYHHEMKHIRNGDMDNLEFREYGDAI